MKTLNHIYVITTRNGDNTFTVRALDYISAAKRAAIRLYGKTIKAVLRTTGTDGMSGYFQGYDRVNHDGALSSHGEPFHISKREQ